MKYLNVILVLVLLSSTFYVFGQNSSWETWRGPNANGSINEADWSPDKIIDGKGILWSKNVGTGHSSVAISGDKLYTMGNWEISENSFIDRVVCLDLNTGETLWKFEYDMDELEDPGPFSTPLLSEGNLYTLGRGGQLYCFDAGNGDVKWAKNLVSLGMTREDCEFACSPIIIDHILVLNMNLSGLAIDCHSGDVIWNSKIDQRGLSTAVELNFNDSRLVAIQGDKETRAVNYKNGEVEWMIPEGHICDPIIIDNNLLIYSYKGTSLYNLLSNPPERKWHNPEIKAQFQSFVTVDGYSYGFASYGGMKLICFEISTGHIKWASKMSAGSLIVSNDILIVIDKEGILRFIEASPEAYNEIGNAAVIDMAKTEPKGRGYRRINACWTNPVLVNQKLYIRNSYGELVCLDAS